VNDRLEEVMQSAVTNRAQREAFRQEIEDLRRLLEEERRNRRLLNDEIDERIARERELIERLRGASEQRLERSRASTSRRGRGRRNPNGVGCFCM